MSGNELKTAFRSILKYRFQNLINLLGLILGITFAIIVAGYFWYSKQVNSEIKNVQQQFLLSSKFQKPGFGLELTTIGALPKALKTDYPSLVKNYYRMDGITCIVGNGKDYFQENGAVGDPSVLTMFGFELYQGNAQTALTEPYTVVLTESLALKYFGTTNALNKNITIQNFNGEKHDFKVTGVIKKGKPNTITDFSEDIKSNLFLPIASESFFGRSIDNWQNPYILGFVELQKDVTPDQLAAPIQQLMQQHQEKDFAANYSPDLKRLSTIYLDANEGAVKHMLYLLTGIAALILLIAIINFINFNMAQHMTRLKEIGIRKIMGASRRQVASQLMVESQLLVFFAAGMSIILYIFVRPYFSTLFSIPLPVISAFSLILWIVFFLFTLVVGLISGFYPALKLSGNQIVSSVKDQLSAQGKKHFLQKSLLLIQFALALFLLISTYVISKQIHLLLHGDLGYNKDFLLTVQVPRDWSETGVRKMKTIQQELKELPEVEAISLSYDIPGMMSSPTFSLHKEQNHAQVKSILVDADFLQTYQIPLRAGTFFNPNKNSEQEIVINEKTAQLLGFTTPAQAIGQQIQITEFNQPFMIKGVTGNLITQSMHESLPALIYTNIEMTNQFRYFTMRLHVQNIGNSIEKIGETWKKLMPQAPFEYQFLDDRTRKIYQTELLLQQASGVASAAAMIIVALGIIGLISLSVQIRVKEIGIRQVLGASMSGIIMLFSKEFFYLFSGAVLIVTPLSYYFTHQWLAQYTYKIKPDFVTFFLPVTVMLLFTALLISLLIIGKIKNTPVKNLRQSH